MYCVGSQGNVGGPHIGKLVGPVLGCAQLAEEDKQSPFVLAESPLEVTLGAAGSPLEVAPGAAGSPLVLLQGVWRQLMMGEPCR